MLNELDPGLEANGLYHNYSSLKCHQHPQNNILFSTAQNIYVHQQYTVSGPECLRSFRLVHFSPCIRSLSCSPAFRMSSSIFLVLIKDQVHTITKPPLLAEGKLLHSQRPVSSVVTPIQIARALEPNLDMDSLKS